MTQITRPIDEAWGLILNYIRKGRCAVFLGAGASAGDNGGPGVQTASELAKKLAVKAPNRKHHYRGPFNTDFFRMAQYLEGVTDSYFLRESIVECITEATNAPGPVHRALAGLPIAYYLTTNFDNLMEKALEEPSVKKMPTVGHYKRNAIITQADELPEATIQKPLVYKLHGTITDPLSITATEHDLVEFMARILNRAPPLPLIVSSLFQTHSFLFIGYGLKDWNIRVLWQAIRTSAVGTIPAMKSFAVQKRPNNQWLGQEWDQGIRFWDRRGNLLCYDIPAVEFARELKLKYDSGEGI